MFEESTEEDKDITNNAQLDNKNLDPFLQRFIESPERESILEDSVSIPSSERLRFSGNSGGPCKESASMLFPFLSKNQQGTL